MISGSSASLTYGWQHELVIPTPVLAVRAVCGTVALDAAGRVLLVQRRDMARGVFLAGGFEPGETWVRAAVRECLEETGWHIEVRSLLGVYSDPATQVHHYPGGREVQFYGVVFLASARRNSGTRDGEATDVAFFALDELPGPIFGPDRPALMDARTTIGRPLVR